MLENNDPLFSSTMLRERSKKQFVHSGIMALSSPSGNFCYVNFELSPEGIIDLKTNPESGRHFFEAKGYRWARTLTFSLCTDAVQTKDKVFVCRYWGKPTSKVERVGKAGSLALDGSGWIDCNCDECFYGRLEVDKGWMPE